MFSKNPAIGELEVVAYAGACRSTLWCWRTRHTANFFAFDLERLAGMGPAEFLAHISTLSDHPLDAGHNRVHG